jgi:predicted nucleic acid-binding protein
VFIFDTDIYTNVMKKIPSKKLIARLKKVPRKDQFTTAITIGEVFYGIMTIIYCHSSISLYSLFSPP